VTPLQRLCIPLVLCALSYVSELEFLGAFSKLRKATVAFVMCVRLSVCMEQLGFHSTDFLEI